LSIFAVVLAASVSGQGRLHVGQRLRMTRLRETIVDRLVRASTLCCCFECNQSPHPVTVVKRGTETRNDSNNKTPTTQHASTHV